MARSLAHLLAGGSAIALAALPLAACLRMVDEPLAWPCESDRDCEAGEFCHAPSTGSGRCRSPGYCESDAECDRLQACQGYTCVDVECKSLAAEACAPYTCDYSYTCRRSCAGDTECLEQYMCASGSCVPRVECSAADAQSCGGFACEAGRCASSCTTTEGCAEGYACVNARCEPIHPPVCTANEVFCEGSVYSTCDATGQAVLPGSRDCEDDGLECTVVGCGDAVSAVVMADECSSAGSQTGALGNIYWVNTPVTLVDFTQLMDFHGTPEVRWFVYASTTLDGPYTELVSGYSDSGVSPVFGVELEGSHYYLLGAESSNLGPNGFCGIAPADVAVGFGTFMQTSYFDPSGIPEVVSNPTSSIGNALQFVNAVILP